MGPPTSPDDTKLAALYSDKETEVTFSWPVNNFHTYIYIF